MDGFFFDDVDQIAEMVANRALAVFVECLWKPEGAAVGQRTEAGVDVVKARINQFDGNDEAAEQVRDGAMRVDVGTEFVAAEQNVAAEECVPLAFEIKVLRQPDDFVAMLFHPTGEMRRFAGAFLVPEITWNKTATDR